jgi:hypothetical protein
LTGESEERETWTAESPRTAISLGLACSQVGFNADMRSDETSAVDVSGQHYGCESNQSGTSSNVVISREKVLSKHESLILAQSERWRQA